MMSINDLEGFVDGAQLPIEVYDEAFGYIVGPQPKLAKVASGHGFTEGPCYVGIKGLDKGYLFFTDQLKDNILILRWKGLSPYDTITTLSWDECAVFRHPSNIANGMLVDTKGRLLVAETTARRISITDFKGEVQTLVGSYEGKPFNSPNDLVEKSDGSIWFTDPSYGSKQFLHDNFLPNCVYRFDPNTKEVHPVITDMKMPNGLAFSPDESLLYVSDSSAVQGPQTFYANNDHCVYSYPLSPDGKTVGKKELFADISPGVPDGFTLDEKGNLYISALDGIQVFSPDKKLIGKILMPKAAANVTFGGVGNNILFICATDCIWAIKLFTRGLKPIPIIDRQF